MFNPNEIYQGEVTKWNGSQWITSEVISIDHSFSYDYQYDLTFQVTEYPTMDEAIKDRAKMLFQDSLHQVTVTSFYEDDDTVEFDEGKLTPSFLSVSEFIAKYGAKLLYGSKVEVLENNEGTLYVF